MNTTKEAQFRVGLLVPSSNATMERDFHRNLPEDVHVATSRMFLDETTKQAEIRMLEESLPEANRMLKTVEPHFCVFGCTSGGALFGQTHDKKIKARIEEETGAETATILSALAREFADMNAKRLVVLTPYVDELNGPICASLEEDGMEVLSIDGMGITDNIKIGNTRADKILKFADEKLSTQNLKKADCLFHLLYEPARRRRPARDSCPLPRPARDDEQPGRSHGRAQKIGRRIALHPRYPLLFLSQENRCRMRARYIDMAAPGDKAASGRVFRSRMRMNLTKME